MPAKSKKQRRLMAIAEHHPEMVKAKNRGVLKMSHEDMHDFASTKETKMKGKSKKNHKPKGGENPFFGNSLPFGLGQGGNVFGDSRKRGPSVFKKGK